MTARFILSLDCEGKWGVADHLGADLHRSLNDAGLRLAYRQIIELLDEYSLPATFAFVGCFAEETQSLHRLMPELAHLGSKAADYLGPAIHDMTEGSREGWHGAWAVEQVAQAPTLHEIALHGVTHVPWTDLDRKGAYREMALLAQMETPVRHARTFIYPRNKIAHQDVLEASGILGYRLSPPDRSRLSSLTSEFDIWSRPDADSPASDVIVPIPAGFFVNWQSGLRRLVPNNISLLRARRLLDAAERTGGVVHYWLHPENIATAPATLGLLRSILEVVAERRDKGRCDVLTQQRYVEHHTGHQSLTLKMGRS
ncbi:polysaccharide deacetylase family protein [Altererythrobacter confluentis]|uniref:Chitooligosaccharide deacetylase n=1 Tax=Allopontixanthobacter confluentis TaxID=1849021 RepID=A0A6L7GDX9_9SPHN|nr:polysaccharide deacetylase family protein [Allopontixanthobacter confluentis]MXP13328.1 polysaccharide deacetylase family protein [Allopontixanthobacter confluentis]